MPPDHAPQATHLPVPPLVLDTNVLLDWLVFRDPSTATLGHAIRSGAWQWVATTAMREELEQVLTREHLLSRQSDPHFALATWDAFARPVGAVSIAQPGAMRCTDPDDQKFIDLALQLGAVLLSRDRAVLRLARAGRTRGVQILTPTVWAASNLANLVVSG
jgi:uncharacterized protein